MQDQTNTPQSMPKVIMNNKEWDANDLTAFEQVYGKAPAPGDYWYDKISGMYGVMGQPAAGFLRPGHEYGDLPSYASNGNTKVFFNNRELSQIEYMGLCATIGTYVMPGHYWLDAMGNAGMQGNPFPLVNLFAAAQQRNFGGGGGGDNFWSSRFSAGNSDGDSGYVSVPGYGAVGYDSSGWS